MQNDPQISQSSSNDAPQTPDAGLELGHAIYKRYGDSSGTVSGGLELGRRISLFAIDRLPLMTWIQRRWMIGGMPLYGRQAMRQLFVRALPNRRRLGLTVNAAQRPLGLAA